MIVSGGLDSPYTILQGYGVGAITLVVSPSVITSLVNSTVTLTASVACTWSTDIGSLVVSGDHLSAVWTAPGVVGTGTITATDESDPGNTVDVPVVVVAYFAGNFVLSGGAGTLVDSGQPGAYGSGVTAPAPPPPVLLPDLVAGWALTAGPQQTLDSTGVIASGALDLTNNNNVTFSAQGAAFDVNLPTNKCLTHLRDATLDADVNDLFISTVIRLNSRTTAEFILYQDPDGDFEYSLEYSNSTDRIRFVMLQNNFASRVLSASTFGQPPLNTDIIVNAWHRFATAKMYISVNAGATNELAITGLPPAGGEFEAYVLGLGGMVNLAGTDGSERFTRIWIGDISAPISANTWLGTAPRTDADIASYTGS